MSMCMSAHPVEAALKKNRETPDGIEHGSLSLQAAIQPMLQRGLFRYQVSKLTLPQCL